jgi:hypothetical protein
MRCGNVIEKWEIAKNTAPIDIGTILPAAVIIGRWERDYGKADVYVGRKSVCEVDNYYWVMEGGAGFDWLNGAHLFHVRDLKPGRHTI